VKIALSPEAVEPQRGIDLRADHDSNACRKPLDQVPQPLVDVLVVDRVVVVEDERDAGEAGGRVDDERQDVVLDDDARCLQSAQHLLSEAGSNGPEGGHHIGPEDGRRVVAPVERQPGDVPVVRREAHWASSVDLPAPTPAETSVSRTAAPRSTSYSSAVRSTHPGLSAGASSFVSWTTVLWLSAASTGPPRPSDPILVTRFVRRSAGFGLLPRLRGRLSRLPLALRLGPVRGKGEKR
jgi:hypothetical protein